MKLRTITDVEAFRAAINSCTGSVWLESAMGDKFDLKSIFSQYIAIGRLLEDHNEELEIFASETKDRAILVNFMNSTKE